MSDKQRALDAIRSENVEEAQRLAVDLVKGNPADAEAWYLLSLAVPGDRGATYRQKALLLDPEIDATFEVSQVSPVTLTEPASPQTVPAVAAPTPTAKVEPKPDPLFPPEDLPTEYFPVPNAKQRVPKKAPSGKPKSIEAGAKSGFDANLMLLIFFGVLIVIVLAMLVASLFS